MTEKLTIDQKIQIAQIAENIVSHATAAKLRPTDILKERPTDILKERPTDVSQETLFNLIYASLIKTITNNPEKN